MTNAKIQSENRRILKIIWGCLPNFNQNKAGKNSDGIFIFVPILSEDRLIILSFNRKKNLYVFIGAAQTKEGLKIINL